MTEESKTDENPMTMHSSNPEMSLDNLPAFGADMRQEFGLNLERPNVLVNHGMCGAAPKRVIAYRDACFMQMEEAPDYYFWLSARPLYDAALARVARFLGAEQANLVFQTNATTGMNTALKNVELSQGDTIVVDPHLYWGIRFLIRHVKALNNVNVVAFDSKPPYDDVQKIVQAVEKTCSAHSNVRVVITDHIAWSSGLIFPVEEVAALLKRLGIIYIVDGAHVPGQMLLELERLGEKGVDFYVGNMHKWAFAPRSCAVLWAHPRHHETLMPLVTSLNNISNMQDRFFLQGTTDNSNFLAAAKGIDFIEAMGGVDSIREYVEPMLDWAQDHVAQQLGTEKFNIRRKVQAPFFRFVAIPEPHGFKVDQRDANSLLVYLMRTHNLDVSFVEHSGKLWVRLAGSVYNVKDDYVRAAEILKTFFQSNKGREIFEK